MKEIKLKQDEYKNIDVRTLKPNEFLKIKILPDSKVVEKEIAKPTPWISYSMKVLHNGEESWLKMTGAVAKKLKKSKGGELYSIFAVPSELKGGKAYSVSLEEEDSSTDLFSEPVELTDRVKEDFDTIIGKMKSKGFTSDQIDDATIIKALSGNLGYELSTAEGLVKEFFRYAKGK